MNTQETDRVERTILLHAPCSRVWKALTDIEEFGRWFGVQSHDSFTPGARVRGMNTRKGFEKVKWDVTVAQMEPERLFSWRWHPYAIDRLVDYSAEPTTQVVFRLEPAANDTKLSVFESGFGRLPPARRSEAYAKHEEGWTLQLKSIEEYLGRSGG
ncbi:MAG: SRPBCC family protein [Pseudomonadota bacterium]